MKRYIAAVGIVVVVPVLVICLGACSAKSNNSGEGEASSTSSSSSFEVKVVEPETQSSSCVAKDNIAGLDSTNLSDEERDKLADYLDELCNNKTLKSLDECSVSDATSENGLKRVIVNDSYNETSYVVSVGDVCKSTKLDDVALAEEKKQVEEHKQTEEALQERAKQDAALTALDSPETEFDVRSSWLLSMHDKVDPVIGKKVAKRLLDDINGFLFEEGVTLEKESLVYVADELSEENDKDIVFYVQCVLTRVHPILKCSYNTKTLEHTIELMP